MTLGDVFLYLVLFLVSIWTARIAISKGRNAWGWGGAALILGLIHVPESSLLGVVPVLVLLFIKSPSTPPAVQPDRLSCPRCAKSHSGGQHFCTGCGWDLSVAYSPEEPEGAQASHPQPQAQDPSRSTTVAETPEAAETSAPEASRAEPPTSEPHVTKTGPTEAPEAPATTNPQESVAETEQPAEAVAAEAEEEPETESMPWGAYQPSVAPTAAVMTARGIERFDEDKFQEAIDQFTKAIALDSTYAEAWQRRAEAYTQLGRSEQAAEDRRHVQGLDPSSSPG